jgi:hypothetical protein
MPLLLWRLCLRVFNTPHIVRPTQALQDLLSQPQEAAAVRADIVNLMAKPRWTATTSLAGAQGAATNSAGAAYSTAAGSAAADVRTQLCKEMCAAERSVLALVQPLHPSITQRLQLLGLTRELAALQHTDPRVACFRVDLRVSTASRGLCLMSSACWGLAPTRASGYQKDAKYGAN